MKLYFAPMEGITTYIYRNLHYKHYKGIDKYYSPFVSPGPDQGLSVKEIRDVLPENNPDIPMIPQLMTNRSVDFIMAAKVMKDRGYTELNFNLGCPSGTVVSKKKGSGFLAYPDDLNRFLDEVFSDPFLVNKEVEVSIKTRAGKVSHEEWPRLMEIYNQYPIKELIIHPRVQQDMYKNTPSWDVFAQAVEESKIPLVFNGDIFRVPEFLAFAERFPQIDRIMLGRGIIRNPELAERILALDEEGSAVPDQFDKKRFRQFHDDLIEAYSDYMYGERPVLYKMKELWFYMISMFPDSQKIGKKIMKSNHLAEYQTIVEQLF
ncbi:MAG: tRNA-dihydrouridine synthase [Firmicutes bacterium]|nr:tRNA-dihydrouridine synthase [Bacillota bacterium]